MTSSCVQMELSLIRVLGSVTGGLMWIVHLRFTNTTLTPTCIERKKLRKYSTFILERSLTFIEFQPKDRVSLHLKGQMDRGQDLLVYIERSINITSCIILMDETRWFPRVVQSVHRCSLHTHQLSLILCNTCQKRIITL